MQQQRASHCKRRTDCLLTNPSPTSSLLVPFEPSCSYSWTL
uniref:Uncharacterized protein n=1 Tax=Arundo donax TaxID=35708 RepID=A0A0A9FYT5_ARUDO